jgi:hypothetical protein
MHEYDCSQTKHDFSRWLKRTSGSNAQNANCTWRRTKAATTFTVGVDSTSVTYVVDPTQIAIARVLERTFR